MTFEEIAERTITPYQDDVVCPDCVYDLRQAVAAALRAAVAEEREANASRLKYMAARLEAALGSDNRQYYEGIISALKQEVAAIRARGETQ